MITVTRLLQAAMAITAMIWFILYEQSFVNLQLSVTIVLFILSKVTFVLRHLPDITTYGVLPTLTLVVLAPIVWDCSPFQGRHIAAIIPLFLCAVLFFAVELARAARALERLADRRQGYVDFGDDPRTSMLTVDQYSMTDAESGTPRDSIDNPPAIWRPRRSPESIAFGTIHTKQAAPVRHGWNRVGRSGSIQLTTSSISGRESLVDLLSGIDGFLAGSRTCTLPRERGPYYPSYYVKRWCNELPQVDLGEYQSESEDQSELDDRQLDPDERHLPEVW